MRSMVQARIKRARAVELAAEGLSYDEIAAEVGFSHRGSAHRAVFKALSERELEAVELLRHVELVRLDDLHAAHWPRAMEGDHAATELILKVMDRRFRLLGLDAKTSKRREEEPVYLVRPGAWDEQQKRLRASSPGSPA